jgi:hypothetical protein
MENKYFTPDIENIHVGFICYQYNKFYDGHGIKFDERWAEDLTLLVPAAVRILINEESNIADFIRVPYLTKEQIEAEGWSKAKVPIVTIKHDFYEIPYIKDNFRIDYNFKNKLINILENNGVNLFYGECKDINTFIKIIKLLNI